MILSRRLYFLIGPIAVFLTFTGCSLFPKDVLPDLPGDNGDPVVEELVTNPGFENFGTWEELKPDPSDRTWKSFERPPGWSLWKGTNTKGEGVWTSEDARSGQFSIKIYNADVAMGYTQRISVEPGATYAAVAFVNAHTTGTVTLHINVFPEDPSEGPYAAQFKDQLSNGVTDGWVPLSLLMEIPEGANEIQIVTDVRGQSEGEYVYWDDFSVIRVE